MIKDERGNAVDLVILAANHGFAEASGLKVDDAIGPRLTHALPGIAKDAADWIGT